MAFAKASNKALTHKVGALLLSIHKTGDTTNLPLLYALAGLSAVGIVVCGVIGFKKKKKEDRN